MKVISRVTNWKYKVYSCCCGFSLGLVNNFGLVPKHCCTHLVWLSVHTVHVHYCVQRVNKYKNWIFIYLVEMLILNVCDIWNSACRNNFYVLCVWHMQVIISRCPPLGASEGTRIFQKCFLDVFCFLVVSGSFSMLFLYLVYFEPLLKGF